MRVSGPIFVLSALAACTLPRTAIAQQCSSTGDLEGTVTSEIGEPIPRATLEIRGASAVADSGGRYRLTGACAGPGILTARRIGFVPGTWSVAVPAGEARRLNLVLTAASLELDPVIVTAEPRGSTQRLREFYLRRERLPGRFLTREDLAPLDNWQLTDALRSRIAGLRIVPGSGTIRNHVRLRGQRCAPMVWIDGMSTPAGEYDLDVITTSSLAGIEVYSGPATVPVEFRTPFGRDGCGGAIVLWSRIGPDQMGDRPRAPARDATPSTMPIHAAHEVDVPAGVDSARLAYAVYPDSLLAFEVEGEVVAEFVVDTSGMPLDGTIRIVSATAPEFGESARSAIAASRFTPARLNGRVVRQVMTLPYHFRRKPDR